ncbi:hypothetical protein B0J11DRAFT_137909 [Dendryphion nanum]|uniref:Uncharacterized protein n=1 Tax=Dendryphion nanum TaxID=256645 RepID=A0A9P9D8Z1_9PLEO|nr:hypothetical protein B0J11DRAFT_137909 [Dendryphion nanum]
MFVVVRVLGTSWGCSGGRGSLAQQEKAEDAQRARGCGYMNARLRRKGRGFARRGEGGGGALGGRTGRAHGQASWEKQPGRVCTVWYCRGPALPTYARQKAKPLQKAPSMDPKGTPPTPLPYPYPGRPHTLPGSWATGNGPWAMGAHSPAWDGRRLGREEPPDYCVLTLPCVVLRILCTCPIECIPYRLAGRQLFWVLGVTPSLQPPQQNKTFQ